MNGLLGRDDASQAIVWVPTYDMWGLYNIRRCVLKPRDRAKFVIGKLNMTPNWPRKFACLLQHGLKHRFKSPGERLITLSISAVAVCC